MKHLKYYESNTRKKYNIGDHVILNIKEIIKNYTKDNDEIPKEENMPDDKIGIIHAIREEENYPFAIKFYTNTIFEVNKKEILRKASITEINNLNSKITANKYNL